MAGASQALDSLFYPESIAVFGSVKQGKIAHQVITQVVAGAFSGTLYAVNPKGETPEGFPQITAAAGVLDLKEKIDLAVICTPAVFVEQVLDDCGRKKIPIAVILTSGFSEAGNKEGEERLLATAGKQGIRIIGPNCAGIMNTSIRLFASIEVRALPGRTAFITQSGAVGGAVLALAELRGIGFSKFVSYGNRADIGENELLRYLGQDDETDVIAVYLESLQDGRGFLAAARELSGKKPLLIIKSGRSSSGVRAAGSHTGSMAGSDRVFAAMVKQAGAVRVAGMEELLDLCYGFSTLTPPGGRRIAIVTNSGGPGILTSDRGEELGLEIAEPSPAVRKKLKGFLPEHCGFSNPIDLTVEGSGENYRRTLEILLAGGYDGAIAINVATPFLDSSDLAAGIAAAAGQHLNHKPVAAVFMAGKIVESGIERLKQGRVPVFPTGERAASVLAAMSAYYGRAGGGSAIKATGPGGRENGGPDGRPGARLNDRATGAPGARLNDRATGSPIARPERRAPAAAVKEEALPLKAPLKAPVTEPEVVAFLQGEGFPFPAHCFVDSGRQMEKAALEMGFPLVMKIVSPRILHKSDLGGVVLNIDSREELEAAYQDMENRFRESAFQGTMLYKQVSGGTEIIAGIKRDPDFGPVVLAGAGGVLTELLQDSSLRIAPFEKDEALAMLAELKISRLFSGFRGEKSLDLEATADLLVLLSQLSVKYPDIRELDFNPVFVFEEGLLIGDARIIL